MLLNVKSIETEIQAMILKNEEEYKRNPQKHIAIVAGTKEKYLSAIVTALCKQGRYVPASLEPQELLSRLEKNDRYVWSEVSIDDAVTLRKLFKEKILIVYLNLGFKDEKTNLPPHTIPINVRYREIPHVADELCQKARCPKAFCPKKLKKALGSPQVTRVS